MELPFSSDILTTSQLKPSVLHGSQNSSISITRTHKRLSFELSSCLRNRHIGVNRPNCPQQIGCSNWKPTSLKWQFLVTVITTSICVVVVLQLLLSKSQQDGGIVFATNVNELPLGKTFQYKYLPTIIAVLYGFLWAWIDLDVRRLEPFYQLSSQDGVAGKQSILLDYPVNFLMCVPIKAFRHRHWQVFAASIATLIVFWGIVPIQSGIFAFKTLDKVNEMSALRSVDFLPVSQEESSISASSATSVSNIIWLNESLQPFMSRDFILTSFMPGRGENVADESATWTAASTLYSVNVSCEQAIPYSSESVTYVNSSWGCNFELPPPRTGELNTDESKIFDVLYVGYSDADGAANYYLSDGSCPSNESQTFLAQMSKALIPPSLFFNMTGDQQREHANVTTLWCRSDYFVMNVTATIRLSDNSVLAVESEGIPQPLPANFFNVSAFEAAMSVGQELYQDRTDFPTPSWPDQRPYVQNMPLNVPDIEIFPKMAAYAIGATQLSLEDYLDPSVLSNSYQSAYRLLFARQLADFVSTNLNLTTASIGDVRYSTQAIFLVPTFTFIVEALLCVTIVIASWLLVYSIRRPIQLREDPSNILTMMALAAEDDSLIQTLRSFDQATEKELCRGIGTLVFRLSSKHRSGYEVSIQLLRESENDTQGGWVRKSINKLGSTACPVASLNEETEDIVAGLQPYEFRLGTGAAFLAAQIAMFVIIGVLHVRIKSQNGLSLPSQARFVRQLLESYLPTAIGTLIGPFWMVLNRHMCMLQPFEELRKRRSSAEDSIAVSYTAIPPQLVVWRAFRKGGRLLAALCLMTLLADVLSISLASLLFENIVASPAQTPLWQPYQLLFQPLNGTAAPFDDSFVPLGQLKGDATVPFLVAASNQTAETPMPPWTDEEFFYLPFIANLRQQNSSWSYRAVTPVIGAQLQCEPLSTPSAFQVTGIQANETGEDTIPSTGNLTVLLSQEDGPSVTCVPRGAFPYFASEAIEKEQIYGKATGPSAFEFAYGLDGCTNGTNTLYGLACGNSSTAAGALCRDHVAGGWVRANLMNGTLSSNTSLETPWEATVIVCKSLIVAGTADVMVSADGHVLSTFSRNVSSDDVEKYFMTSPDDLLSQANQYILDNGAEWHIDSFPSDWTNYLIEKAINSSRYLDPHLPPPSAEDVITPFSALYSKLFAILLGRDMDLLLVKNTNNTTYVSGSIIKSETRIFMSKTMFFIAETILLLYIATTITFYIKRPWRTLTRMPTSPASIIAFFAASNALKDFKGAASMTQKQLKVHLSRLGARYGFGSFIGTDGEPHIGIEKYPFLAPLTRAASGAGPAKMHCSSEGWIGRWQRKFVEWKLGRVMEGGWI